MQELRFSKWQGTGNDFIVIDDREGSFPAQDLALVRRLCDRHFGIGSDGLILIQAPRTGGTSYHMEFFNPDASKSFCGNGSRCAFAFWSSITDDHGPTSFTAIDGEHKAAWVDGSVMVGMRPVSTIEVVDARTDLINTGSPHLVIWVDDPAAIDLIPEARKYRYNPVFGLDGVNVNFVRWHDGRVEMRTYERGVEAETLSCGTGVTAAALSALRRGHGGEGCDVRTPGGDLRVLATTDGAIGFAHISLCGPAIEVFQGSVQI